MAKRQELEPSCCAIGSDGTEEVHVLESDCPINREEGKRKVKPIREGEPERTECTCIYMSSFGGRVKPCEHYRGCKQVQRNKRKVWRVFCDAVKNDTPALSK
ncbi:hypothetical protein JK635_07655 [Neobacillus sp. YIM B02564]|uniref:SWIM-type domain-containing protein n=1 Tax=Neobacillus paridis TaxID=2803862 RepID=A0ABS1TM61_9BACI|nr:hypothetical protein [Neobacillus paridis]MBL4952084.1 hypothetical protein [Neobacillus paridis]